MMELVLQIIVLSCFVVVIIALFREKSDFLFFSMAAMLISATSTYFLSPVPVSMEELFLSVDWEVIFFLISLFTIVAVLEEKKIFQELARRITTKFSTNTRRFFWVICMTSTISAAFIEDVSVAIIFIPMIINTSKKMRINPTPILLGMTICINLASTLTPFGSAQNILIADQFFLSSLWFFINTGLYFLIATLTTLFLLDKFILRKHLKDIWTPECLEKKIPVDKNYIEEHELVIIEKPIPRNIFNKNIVSLLIFFGLLIFIPNILFIGLVGMLLFVFLNPRRGESGKKYPDISYYLKQVDFKLIFFFISLFILVFSFEKAGIIQLLEDFVLNIAPMNIFLLSVMILIVTSLLSGFLDNVPVTVLFIPIIQVLSDNGFASIPMLVAFILGINLGGNFLPQGSAADMMTLELSKKYCADDLNYKRLLKVGGIFATYHIVLGIGYLALQTFLFL
jgi:Na+/H+ antiporter NhaD/arsenite permease-like protein